MLHITIHLRFIPAYRFILYHSSCMLNYQSCIFHHHSCKIALPFLHITSPIKHITLSLLHILLRFLHIVYTTVLRYYTTSCMLHYCTVPAISLDIPPITDYFISSCNAHIAASAKNTTTSYNLMYIYLPTEVSYLKSCDN
jgi:hypothetical protein